MKLRKRNERNLLKEMSNELVILLCTYNGEKYIKEQLDSLFNQTIQCFTIHLHDDGSTDNTLGIIKLYQEKYPGRIIVHKDSCSHQGAKNSFMWLLSKVDADYYMFCDQDDVWKPSKVRNSIRKIKVVEKNHPNAPVLIHTDLEVVGDNLKPISPSFWQYRGVNVDISRKFEYLCFGNVVTGCTMIINKLARDISLPIHPMAPMHDYWIALMVAKHGIIDYIPQQTVLYRQHLYNVAGVGAEYKNTLSIKGFFVWYKTQRKFLKDIGFEYGFRFLYYRLKYFCIRHRVK